MVDEEVLDEQEREEPDVEPEEQADEEASLQEKLKKAIDVRVEDVATLRKKLTVTVPPEAVAERRDEQYGELSRDAVIPGFRKGRAPRRLLEKRFGSEIDETLSQQLVSNAYMAAIEKAELKVIGDPLVWAREKDAESETLMEVQAALDLIELPEDGALEFSCEVELQPEFDLPELEGIPLEKPLVEVSDEDITAYVDRIRSTRGTYDLIEDGGIEPDDVVTADIRMTSGETVLKEQEGVRLAARPQTVDGVVLENLGDLLKGRKVDETVKASGEIASDYVKAEFRGKQADFDITIRKIERLRLPELNQELIESFGFESEQELRDWVRGDLESRIEDQVRQGMAGQVYKYLLDNTEFDVPERLSERQAARVAARRMIEMYQMGMPPTEVEKHLDELRTGAREETARDLKIFFIMEALAEKFEPEVSEAEINGAIAMIAQRQGRRFDRVRDEMARGDGAMNLYLQIRDRKIVDQLIEKASLTEMKPKGKKQGKSADKKGGDAGDAGDAT